MLCPRHHALKVINHVCGNKRKSCTTGLSICNSTQEMSVTAVSIRLYAFDFALFDVTVIWYSQSSRHFASWNIQTSKGSFDGIHFTYRHDTRGPVSRNRIMQIPVSFLELLVGRWPIWRLNWEFWCCVPRLSIQASPSSERTDTKQSLSAVPLEHLFLVRVRV